jgi:dTDP-glucose 4,6-dehydratase
MKNKAILVTGGAGFIGSNFLKYMCDKYTEIAFINLDLLTYASDMNYIHDLNDKDNYVFIQGDVCDRSLVENLFDTHNVDGLIHFAAESHVDNSINNPGVFITTNVVGTFILLDVAYKYWMDKPFSYKDGLLTSRFLHVSTDEVYGSLGSKGLFTELTPYAPNSPYSASKASSDMIVRSFHHTYGLNTIVTNCSNNYGPGQHDEKLIPTIIRNALSDKPIPIYGDGKNIRDWLYVLDHCRGIELAFHEGAAGETYNIGGRNERENIYIAQTICSILDVEAPRTDGKSYQAQISYVDDRPGHDRRYAIDATKIENDLGWRAHENFETGIQKTVKWYVGKYRQ